MLFNSFQFLLFFPLAVLVYFATPRAQRWIPALIASYYFYMCWRPAFVLLIMGSTLVDYTVGILLDRTEKAGARRGLLLASLGVNLGLLFTFKYLDFACQSFTDLLGHMGLQIELPHPNLLLPVGISFYTFQTLSYTIDVFRRRTPTEFHLGRFATFVAFFPQLVAGPIERSQQLLPQFRKGGAFSWDRLGGGLQLMLWGLVKKMCIADLVSVPVNSIFAAPERYDSSVLMVGAVLFAFQIYCDFSGYSDIAIGAARVMGIDLMTNFRRPYFAQSPSEFWQRWHISLSTWFRDYVYIPLGGNRVAKGIWVRNIVITFVVSGLWHGAAWTFVIWGALHAGYLLGERALKRPLSRIGAAVGLVRFPRLCTVVRVLFMFALVDIAWVFFRAPTFDAALDYLGRMFDLTTFGIPELEKLGLTSFEMMLCFVFPVALIAIDYVMERRPAIVMSLWSKTWFRSVAYVSGIYAILLFGVFDEVDFIYFQF